MGTYLIVKPTTIVRDGKATRYRGTGAVVELDDTTATGLGDAVQLLGRSEREPHVHVSRSEPDLPEPQPSPEPEPEPSPEPKSESAAESERPKPRRPKRESDVG